MKQMLSYSVTLLLFLSDAEAAKVTLLSAKEDMLENDFSSIVAHQDEATALWGLGYSVGHNNKAVGTGKTAQDVQKYIRKHRNFFDAAFVLAVNKSPVIEELGKSKEDIDTRLAAAALALGALTGHLSDMKKSGLIVVEHKDSMGEPITEKGARQKGAMRKGRKNKEEKSTATIEQSALLPVLLSARDADTVFFAIQAAAYGRNAEVAEAVRNAVGKTLQIEAAKIFYQAMIGKELTDEEIQSVASRCFTGMRPTKEGPSPSFDIAVPPLSLICQAIGEIKRESLLPLLVKASALKDVRVQIDAVRAMRCVGSDLALPALNALLPSCAWPVLVEACTATGALPSEKMVPALLQRLALEKGRLRLDVVHALSCIAGEQKARDAAGWTAWWTKNRATFKVDKTASEAYRSKTRVQDVDVPTVGFFYGLNIYSDRFTYVIDSSKSMKGSRIESLKQNLLDSLKSLAKNVKFNLVDFGGDIEVLNKGELTSDKKAAVARVAEMDLSLATRSFCAMRQGMLIQEVDTIYFLSDGAPAKDSMPSWLEIQEAVLVMTRYCPTAFFCIDFDPRTDNQKAMINLSDWHFGLHESIEI